MVPPPRRVIKDDTPVNVRDENVQSFAVTNPKSEIQQPVFTRAVEIANERPKASVPQSLDTTVELASYSE